jgi:hypothetical protein
MRIKRPKKRNILITIRTIKKVREIIERVCLDEQITITSLLENLVIRYERKKIRKEKRKNTLSDLE